MSLGRRPPKSSELETVAGMPNRKGDQSKRCASARALDYRYRMTINARGVFWRRSEITATTVSCARRGGLGTYFCAAPGALNGQDTAEGRAAIARLVRQFSAGVRAPRAKAHQ